MTDNAKTVKIEDGGKERKFIIKRMNALQAESWIYRATLAVGKNIEDLSAAFSTGASGLLQALLRVDYNDAKPLLDDLLACCSISEGEAVKGLAGNEALVQSPLTLMRLRVEAAKLNFDFFSNGGKSTFLDALGLNASAPE